MKKGSKARVLQLERRNTAAQAIGHALLDCAPSEQALMCQTALGCEIAQHSRSDLLLAMADQQIDPGPFREEFDREFAAERDRVFKAQEAARLARQELINRKAYKEHEEAFKQWLSERPKKMPEKDLEGDD